MKRPILKTEQDVWAYARTLVKPDEWYRSACPLTKDSPDWTFKAFMRGDDLLKRRLSPPVVDEVLRLPRGRTSRLEHLVDDTCTCGYRRNSHTVGKTSSDTLWQYCVDATEIAPSEHSRLNSTAPDVIPMVIKVLWMRLQKEVAAGYTISMAPRTDEDNGVPLLACCYYLSLDPTKWAEFSGSGFRALQDRCEQWARGEMPWMVKP